MKIKFEIKKIRKPTPLLFSERVVDCKDSCLPLYRRLVGDGVLIEKID